MNNLTNLSKARLFVNMAIHCFKGGDKKMARILNDLAKTCIKLHRKEHENVRT